mgnify:CR=1 FL=1
MSLLLVEGRVVAHCFGAHAWQEVLDDLKARGWIDAEHRLLDSGAVSSQAVRRIAADHDLLQALAGKLR